MNVITHLKKHRVALLNGYRTLRERLGYLLRRVRTPALPKNTNDRVYVNLGCGAHTSKEFVNVDTRPMLHIHYIHEVEELPMFANRTVDLLYASHLLEHVPRDRLERTLKEWYRVLKSGGVLRFGVPDFEGLLRIYKHSGNDVESIVAQLMGGPPPYDDHHTIWNYAYAEKKTKRSGFSRSSNMGSCDG